MQYLIQVVTLLEQEEKRKVREFKQKGISIIDSLPHTYTEMAWNAMTDTYFAGKVESLTRSMLQTCLNVNPLYKQCGYCHFFTKE